LVQPHAGRENRNAHGRKTYYEWEMKMRLWPRDWFAWERKKDELSAELEAHLRMAVEERVARGEDPEDARAAALREMGNPPLVADVTRAQWGWQWLERTAQDVRYALRQLRKSPGYTATALITLTLAIGANTAVFGLMYALLLKSLPVERPDRIVQVRIQLTGHDRKRRDPVDFVGSEVQETLNGKQAVFSGMCTWTEAPLNLHDAQGARPAPSASVTGGCMPMLGVHAALGRLLVDSDDKPGGAPEGFPVVLGYDYWHTQMGADPDVIGKVLDFGASFSTFSTKAIKGVVVGVMEPGFESIRVGSRPWMYVPLEMTEPKEKRYWGSMDKTMLARLRDDVTPAGAQAQIDGIFNAQLKALHGFNYPVAENDRVVKAAETHLLLTPGRTGYSYLRENYQKPLYLMEGMVGLSLLVACAYLALLASTRALARRRELAIRVALGAGRTRVAAGLWYESVLLSLAGGLLGVLFALGAERVLVSLVRQGVSDERLVLHAGPDGVVLLFTLAVTALAVLVAGVLPAWRGSRLNPVNDIKEGESTHSGRRRRSLGAWLVPLEMGISLVIVTVAALMGSTVARLLAVDPGFRESGVTFVTADLSSRTQPPSESELEKMDPAWRKMALRSVPASLYLALLDRIRHTPGVESASISQSHQMSQEQYAAQASSILPSGEVRSHSDLTQLSVTSGYFETLGIPILAGRDFTEEDKQQPLEVCILSRSAAKEFFPNGDAVGSVLTMWKDAPVRVVGIVGDTRYRDLRERAGHTLYLPYLSTALKNPYASFDVRSRDSATAVAAVRNAFRELAPEAPVVEAATMQELVQSSIGRERMVALLAGFFAVLTLVLSAIGMYGLLNYSVLQRTREIGVRMALGASRRGVVRLVVREALWMVVPGLVLGGVGAWIATRFVQSMLFGVKPLDPWLLATSVAVLLGTAMVACLLPARRAAAVHPMDALRTE
jgi:predicted permease